MPQRHHTRRLAMQVLYQIDLAGELDRQRLIENLEDEPGAGKAKIEAVDLALGAWEVHEQADPQISELTPDWPTHRQPPVDRAILRLAYHEMSSRITPGRVVINESVELAKEFCDKNTPAFINGVLDKLAKRLDALQEAPAATDKPVSGDAWLNDAISPTTPGDEPQ